MGVSMNYRHVRCDQCGGVIGMYDRDNFTCEKCGKQFELYSVEYDDILINNVTGWIFPIVWNKSTT